MDITDHMARNAIADIKRATSGLGYMGQFQSRDRLKRHAEPDDLICAACDRVLTMAEYVERFCSDCGQRLEPRSSR